MTILHLIHGIAVHGHEDCTILATETTKKMCLNTYTCKYSHLKEGNHHIYWDHKKKNRKEVSGYNVQVAGGNTYLLRSVTAGIDIVRELCLVVLS